MSNTGPRYLDAKTKVPPSGVTKRSIWDNKWYNFVAYTKPDSSPNNLCVLLQGDASLNGPPYGEMVFAISGGNFIVSDMTPVLAMFKGDIWAFVRDPSLSGFWWRMWKFDEKSGLWTFGALAFRSLLPPAFLEVILSGVPTLVCLSASDGINLVFSRRYVNAEEGWIGMDPVSSLLTDHAPALYAYNGTVYAAFVDKAKTVKLFTLNSARWMWSPVQAKQGPIISQGGVSAATTLFGQPYLAWSLPDGTVRWARKFDGTDWTQWFTPPDMAPSATTPAIFDAGGSTNVIGTDAKRDGQMLMYQMAHSLDTNGQAADHNEDSAKEHEQDHANGAIKRG